MSKANQFMATMKQMKNTERNVDVRISKAIMANYEPEDFNSPATETHVLQDGNICVKVRLLPWDDDECFLLQERPYQGKIAVDGKEQDLLPEIAKILYRFAEGHRPRQRNGKKKEKESAMAAMIM